MLQKNKGVDIIVEIGGLRSYEEAANYFKSTLAPEQLTRIQTIHHRDVLIKNRQCHCHV